MSVASFLRALRRSPEAPAPRRGSVRCANPRGIHRMAYVEWGDRRNPRVLVCVHGLTRVGRDFDFIAQRLAPHYRVVCPDVAGRGASGWLPDASGYAIAQYVADMLTLIARLDVEHVHWLGTSMGGLIGMALAALPDSPIGRLVLNDVGPVITGSSLRRIADYVGKSPVFPDMAGAEHYIRAVSAPFGPLTDAQWRHLTEHAVRPAASGGLEMHYDPAIAEPFRQAMALGDIDLWPLYDAIRCPTLCVRGERSDLLTAETLAHMAQRGPRAQIAEIPGVGHAPMFLDAQQAQIVERFLLAD